MIRDRPEFMAFLLSGNCKGEVELLRRMAEKEAEAEEWETK